MSTNDQQRLSTIWTARFAARAALMRRSAVRELLKLTRRPGMISFALGLPPCELFPVEEVRAAANAVLARHGGDALQYSETEGLPELRDWVAARFSRPGLNLTRANVLMVSGSQQALDLIGRVLLNEGDRVIVENPTYLALLGAWRPLGVKFLAAPCDVEGIRVEELAPLLAHQPKLFYTTPNFQNPQGVTMSSPCREVLVDLLAGHNVGLIEDDPYGELRYEGGPLPELLALDAVDAARRGGDSNVIYREPLEGAGAGISRGLGDCAGGSGGQAGHRQTGGRFAYRHIQPTHHPPGLLRQGVLERQIQILRRACRERRDAMLAALGQAFPTRRHLDQTGGRHVSPGHPAKRIRRRQPA